MAEDARHDPKVLAILEQQGRERMPEVVEPLTRQDRRRLCRSWHPGECGCAHGPIDTHETAAEVKEQIAKVVPMGRMSRPGRIPI